jgi:hypothetical protein
MSSAEGIGSDTVGMWSTRVGISKVTGSVELDAAGTSSVVVVVPDHPDAQTSRATWSTRRFFVLPLPAGTYLMVRVGLDMNRSCVIA